MRMQKPLPCYLKTYRKRAGLKQQELARLLGLGDQTSVSKLERRKRNPNLRIAFGCQVIFGVPAHRIFPAALAEIDAAIAARVRHHRLSAPSSPEAPTEGASENTLYDHNPS